MGNTKTCGFGVLNNSRLQEINVGMSMGALHKFENSVKYGEIFYRWPGAVWYTVMAFARQPDGSNDITSGRVGKEVALAALFATGVGAITMAPLAAAAMTGAALATQLKTKVADRKLTDKDLNEPDIGLYESVEEYQEGFRKAFTESNLHCEKKRCYGGGNGSWLIVEGGPFINTETGYWQSGNLTIREADQKEVFEKGKFTEYSHGRYHTEGGLPCTVNCPFCKKK